MSGDSKTKTAGGKSDVPWGILLAISLVLIAVYLVGVITMFQLADDSGTSDPIWERYTFLLAGFEAIVFTAVGWLFGREVNRKQAERAEQATDDAQKKAEEAASAKAKGEGLRQAILSTIPEANERGVDDPTDPTAALRRHAQNTTFSS